MASCTTAPHHAKKRGVPTTTTTMPGIGARSITVGTHQPITGSDAPGEDEVAPATAAFFDYVNANGGIYGRTIVDKVQDDASDPSQASDVVRQLVLDDNVFAVLNGSGTATHGAVQAFLNVEGVPDLFAGSGCTCWNNPSFPWTSGFQPDYTIEGKLLGQYVTQYVKAHPAVTKIGYLYENDPLGQQTVSGVDQEIDTSSVVGRLAYQSTTASLTDAAGLVAKLQAAGAQIVVVATGPQLAALTLLAGADSSYHPLWMVDSSGAEPHTLSLLLQTYGAGNGATYGPGASPDAIMSGVVSDTYLPIPSNSSDPWIALFRKIHDTYIPNLAFDANVVYGMAVGYTFYALMEAVGPHPTRAGVRAVLGTIDLNGPGLTPFAFSKSSRQGMTGGQIVMDDSGTLQPTGPVYVTGDGNTPITSYSGSEGSPPSSF